MSTELSPAELAAVTLAMRAEGVEPTGPLSASLIARGRSNLTFRLTDGAQAWVLRTPPRAGRTPSAHDVAREFTVTRALGDAGFPVPRAVVLEEDPAALGGPFAIAEFVTGRTIQTTGELDDLDDATLAVTNAALVATLADLHRLDPTRIGLGDFGRPDQYAERQLRRWSRQWEIVGDVADDATRGLAARLVAEVGANLPRQVRSSVVHGDYRIDNTLLDLRDGQARVAAVVDWELSTLGDPVADVALMCVYRHPALDDIIGTPTAWASPRIPAADELCAAYVAAGGVDLVDLDQHLALAHLKLAVIAAGIEHRFRAGAGDTSTAGRAVAPLLEAGLGVRIA